jgi:hypothetical protein
VFEVTAADPNTGAESRIEISAPSSEEARRMVNAAGMLAGPVRLLRFEAPSSPAPAQPVAIEPGPQGHAPPGAVFCPRCRGWRWRSGRGGFIILWVVLLFPLGPLLLLIPPKHTCEQCRYAYRSHTSPPGAVRSQIGLLIFALCILAVIAFIVIRSWDAISP